MRWLLLVAVWPLQAHVMSVSTGDVTVTGMRVEYILRVPMYEVAQTQHPETALLDHVQFAGGRLEKGKCFQQGQSYVCAADYLFDAPVKDLDVTCTLYAVTVPNHVHMLRAKMGSREDQAFFDYTFTNSTLTFLPPSAIRKALREISEGTFRSLAGVIQLLFLASLILAARTRKELFALSTAFSGGLIFGALIKWQPAPRFAECAAALSIAYLAVEVLFVPQGGARWIVAGILGVFQGLYLALFLGGAPGYGLIGAASADLAICMVAGFFLAGRVPKYAAYFPLLAGLSWFVFRIAASG